MMNFSLGLYVLFSLGLYSAVNSAESPILDEILKELSHLKANQHNADIEIKALKATTVEIQHNADNEIKALKAKTVEIQHNAGIEIRSLQEEVRALKRENQQLKELQTTNKRFVLPNPMAEKPAFSASLSQHATNLGNNQPIVFDNAFANDLGAYSPISGVFTAPMNGTYFFTATVMSHTAQYLESEICLNGNSLVYMYSYDTHHEQGTNSVVLNLKVGDLVWVRHHVTEGSNAYGGHWSSFSGFMI